MGPDQYGRRSQAPSMDYLARAYRELLARDQAVVELLTDAAVSPLDPQSAEDQHEPD